MAADARGDVATPPRRGRLSYANVTASLPLFVALTGTSYAAIKLPANSVGTIQLKSRADQQSEDRAECRRFIEGARRLADGR